MIEETTTGILYKIGCPKCCLRYIGSSINEPVRQVFHEASYQSKKQAKKDTVYTHLWGCSMTAHFPQLEVFREVQIPVSELQGKGRSPTLLRAERQAILELNTLWPHGLNRNLPILEPGERTKYHQKWCAAHRDLTHDYQTRYRSTEGRQIIRCACCDRQVQKNSWYAHCRGKKHLGTMEGWFSAFLGIDDHLFVD